MSFNGNEKRRHERVNRALAMQFRLNKSKQKGADTDTWHLSMTTDMSASGIAFNSAQGFLPGDILDLQVVLSGVLDVVKAQGKVVRCEEEKDGGPYRVAVELKKHL